MSMADNLNVYFMPEVSGRTAPARAPAAPPLAGCGGLERGTCMLRVGSKAPGFLLQSDEGKEIALKDFVGQRVLLFFFPKANTSG